MHSSPSPSPPPISASLKPTIHCIPPFSINPSSPLPQRLSAAQMPSHSLPSYSISSSSCTTPPSALAHPSSVPSSRTASHLPANQPSAENPPPTTPNISPTPSHSLPSPIPSHPSQQTSLSHHTTTIKSPSSTQISNNSLSTTSTLPRPELQVNTKPSTHHPALTSTPQSVSAPCNHSKTFQPFSRSPRGATVGASFSQPGAAMSPNRSTLHNSVSVPSSTIHPLHRRIHHSPSFTSNSLQRLTASSQPATVRKTNIQQIPSPVPKSHTPAVSTLTANPTIETATTTSLPVPHPTHPAKSHLNNALAKHIVPTNIQSPASLQLSFTSIDAESSSDSACFVTNVQVTVTPAYVTGLSNASGKEASERNAMCSHGNIQITAATSSIPPPHTTHDSANASRNASNKFSRFVTMSMPMTAIVPASQGIISSHTSKDELYSQRCESGTNKDEDNNTKTNEAVRDNFSISISTRPFEKQKNQARLRAFQNLHKSALKSVLPRRNASAIASHSTSNHSGLLMRAAADRKCLNVVTTPYSTCPVPQSPAESKKVVETRKVSSASIPCATLSKSPGGLVRSVTDSHRFKSQTNMQTSVKFSESDPGEQLIPSSHELQSVVKSEKETSQVCRKARKGMMEANISSDEQGSTKSIPIALTSTLKVACVHERCNQTQETEKQGNGTCGLHNCTSLPYSNGKQVATTSEVTDTASSHLQRTGAKDPYPFATGAETKLQLDARMFELKGKDITAVGVSGLATDPKKASAATEGSAIRNKQVSDEVWTVPGSKGGQMLKAEALVEDYSAVNEETKMGLARMAHVDDGKSVKKAGSGYIEQGGGISCSEQSKPRQASTAKQELATHMKRLERCEHADSVSCLRECISAAICKNRNIGGGSRNETEEKETKCAGGDNARISGEGRRFEATEHVTIWNRLEKRKIAGNAAPLGKNIVRYLREHEEYEIYMDQDVFQVGNGGKRKRARVACNDGLTAGDRVTMWNRTECRKVAGNAAPLAKNLEAYLKKNQNCEVYRLQDKVSGMGSGVKAVEEKGQVAALCLDEEMTVEALQPWQLIGKLLEVDAEQGGQATEGNARFEGRNEQAALGDGVSGDEATALFDLEKFICFEGDVDMIDGCNDFYDGTLPPLHGSLEIPN